MKRYLLPFCCALAAICAQAGEEIQEAPVQAEEKASSSTSETFDWNRLFSDEVPERTLGAHADFAGRSQAAERGRFVLSGELRLRWYEWLESIFGATLSMGGGTSFGLHFPQRVYFNLPYVQPFIQSGFRCDNLSRYNTLALEVGGGLQFAWHENAYFEMSALYVIGRFLHDNVDNHVLFAGGSGVRF